MGFLAVILSGIPGAALTNYMLRDQLGAVRMLIAVAAGILLGAVVDLVATFTLYRITNIDASVSAFFGLLASPPLTALAAWRWRPKKLGPNDLRS